LKKNYQNTIKAGLSEKSVVVISIVADLTADSAKRSPCAIEIKDSI
jgi:hypothetical protein